VYVVVVLLDVPWLVAKVVVYVVVVLLDVPWLVAKVVT